MQHATDGQILTLADEERILVSEDTDFGALLARSQAVLPSLVLLRSGDPLTPDDHARLLQEGLPQVEEELAAGAIIVIEPTRLRVRSLPITREQEP
jgi:predicted nuclease of predicted toxin-antitoxin system